MGGRIVRTVRGRSNRATGIRRHRHVERGETRIAAPTAACGSQTELWWEWQ
jgi:hypothetical protein